MQKVWIWACRGPVSGPDGGCLVLARRILQPAPEVVGEGAPDVEVEGGPLAVIVAHLVQRDGGVGEVALRAVALAVVGATAEGAGVQVERAALGDHREIGRAHV